jgi:AraC-like DNA-binding protein
MAILPQVAMPLVRLLYKFWLDHNVPKKILDDILGIDITVDSSSKFGVPSNKMAELHQAAVEQGNDPALGLRLGQYIARSDLTIGDMLLKSATLAIGLEALMAHSMMISESGRFELTEISDDSVRLSFTPAPGVIFSGYQKDMVFSAVNDWFLSVFSDANEFVKYFYNGAEVSGIEHGKLLGCAVYEAKDTYLEISKNLLERENCSANQKLFLQHLAQAKKVISKRIQRLELYAAVRAAINECLLQRCATQENVANQLNLSIRNLQRRLKEAGTTYQVILDDSREALALNLIKDKALPLYEISFLVGFTEPSAFYKAFRRWTGKRPGDYRQDVAPQNEVLQVDKPATDDVALV